RVSKASEFPNGSSGTRQKREAVGLGSAGVSPAGFGVSPKRTSSDVGWHFVAGSWSDVGGSPQRRDAFASVRDARATQTFPPRLPSFPNSRLGRHLGAKLCFGGGRTTRVSPDCILETE